MTELVPLANETGQIYFRCRGVQQWTTPPVRGDLIIFRDLFQVSLIFQSDGSSNGAPSSPRSPRGTCYFKYPLSCLRGYQVQRGLIQTPDTVLFHFQVPSNDNSAENKAISTELVFGSDGGESINFERFRRCLALFVTVISDADGKFFKIGPKDASQSLSADDMAFNVKQMNVENPVALFPLHIFMDRDLLKLPALPRPLVVSQIPAPVKQRGDLMARLTRLTGNQCKTLIRDIQNDLAAESTTGLPYGLADSCYTWQEVIPGRTGAIYPPRQLSDFSSFPELAMLRKDSPINMARPTVQTNRRVDGITLDGRTLTFSEGDTHSVPAVSDPTAEQLRVQLTFDGASAATRLGAWSVVLGLYDAGSMEEQLHQLDVARLQSYRQLRCQWESRVAEQNERDPHFMEAVQLIVNDAMRTDGTMQFIREAVVLPENLLGRLSDSLTDMQSSHGPSQDGQQLVDEAFAWYESLIRLVPGGDSLSFELLVKQVKQQAKNVLVSMRWFRLCAILLSWVTYNQDTCYVQGMSELAALAMHVVASSPEYVESEAAILRELRDAADTATEPGQLNLSNERRSALREAMERADSAAFWLLEGLFGRFASSFKDPASPEVRALSRAVMTLVRCADPQLMMTIESFMCAMQGEEWRLLMLQPLLVVLMRRKFDTYEGAERFFDWMLAMLRSTRTLLYAAAAFIVDNVREQVLARIDRFYQSYDSMAAQRDELGTFIRARSDEYVAQAQHIVTQVQNEMAALKDPATANGQTHDSIAARYREEYEHLLGATRAALERKVEEVRREKAKLVSGTLFDISDINNIFQNYNQTDPVRLIRVADALMTLGSRFGLRDDVDLEAWTDN